MLHDVRKAEVGGEEIELLRATEIERDVLDERFLEDVDGIVLEDGMFVAAQVGEVPLAADGLTLRPLLTDTASSARDSILLEHLRGVTPVPTYCGVRTPSFVFVRYRTGEEELYDLVDDPRQLRNVVHARPNKANELRALTQSLCVPTPPGFSW